MKPDLFMCESCGADCESLSPASWDPELLVGPCCAVEPIEVSEVFRCLAEYQIVLSAKTIGEMCDQVKEHRKNCPVCSEWTEMERAA